LLGEACNDWDIVTDGDAHLLARILSEKLAGHYVHLHDKASRVVVKQAEHETTFDVSPFKGKAIEEDLRQRDFTVNAIALPLAEIVRRFTSENVGGPKNPDLADTIFIDPLNGLTDIQSRRLRAVEDNIFIHDPLRMLRAVRFKARNQLTIDPWTEQLIKRDAKLLPLAASERIHEELYAILERDGATEQLRYLDALGLLTILIPEFIPARGMRQPSPHYWDVLEHSLESVGAFERVARTLQHPNVVAESPGDSLSAQHTAGPFADTREEAEIRILLHEAEQQGIFQLASLTAPRMKLAALLHDIGKPSTHSTDTEGKTHFYDHPQVGIPLARQVMARLSASTQDNRMVQLIVAHHMRPGQLAHVETVSPRAIHRYFVDLGPAGIQVALFSLADHVATLGPGWDEYAKPPDNSWGRHLALVRLLLTRYIRERESILPARLVSAEELMRRLKLEPGPLIGQLLELIAEARAEGRIHSKEEAIWLAEERLRMS